MGHKMRAVVVGGHTRNIGKTSVMAALISGLEPMGWTAVKITQYGHGICSVDGEPCGCEPGEHAFVLTEETDPAGRGDSCRFLAAGARRSLWLRVRQGQLGEAIPALERELARDDCVMIESNSILEFLDPAIYLVVLDSAQRDFKTSAKKFLARADVLVPVASRFDARAWPALDVRLHEDKPRFPVAPPEYFSPELCRFVRQKLNASTPPATSWKTSLAGQKEQPCRH